VTKEEWAEAIEIGVQYGIHGRPSGSTVLPPDFSSADFAHLWRELGEGKVDSYHYRHAAFSFQLRSLQIQSNASDRMAEATKGLKVATIGLVAATVLLAVVAIFQVAYCVVKPWSPRRALGNVVAGAPTLRLSVDPENVLRDEEEGPMTRKTLAAMVVVAALTAGPDVLGCLGRNGGDAHWEFEECAKGAGFRHRQTDWLASQRRDRAKENVWNALE
jgi:hypothetical protein